MKQPAPLFHKDHGVSEIISTILLVILVIALASIVLGLVSGLIPNLLWKPPLAGTGASTEVVTTPFGNARLISVINIVGDTLTFTKNTMGPHEKIKEVKFIVVPPDGTQHEVITSNSMKPDFGLAPGDRLFVFYDGHVAPDAQIGGSNTTGFWLTNDISTRKDQEPPFLDLSQYPRHYTNDWHSLVGTAAGKGTWKLQIVDMNSNFLVAELPFDVN